MIIRRTIDRDLFHIRKIEKTSIKYVLYYYKLLGWDFYEFNEQLIKEIGIKI